VSEKFFALRDVFGPARVGMMTGDASVNADAPIVCWADWAGGRDLLAATGDGRPQIRDQVTLQVAGARSGTDAPETRCPTQEARHW
jgi:hypothetical protein